MQDMRRSSSPQEAQKIKKVRETDLYKPVKKLLEDMGYGIKSEVGDVDIAALKGESLLIVELKTSINLKLVIQAAKRQRMTDKVYVAVPRPVFKKRFNRNFNDKKYLLRRLGIGLILVALDAEDPYAAVAFEPGGFDTGKSRRSSSRKRKSLVKEMESRDGDWNVGGSNRTKLVTAYREKALKIACRMSGGECAKTRDLKKEGCPPETTRILYDNHYGWFERTGRGEYRLTREGEQALAKYKNVLGHITTKGEEDE